MPAAPAWIPMQHGLYKHGSARPAALPPPKLPTLHRQHRTQGRPFSRSDETSRPHRAPTRLSGIGLAGRMHMAQRGSSSSPQANCCQPSGGLQMQAGSSPKRLATISWEPPIHTAFSPSGTNRIQLAAKDCRPLNPAHRNSTDEVHQENASAAEIRSVRTP